MDILSGIAIALSSTIFVFGLLCTFVIVNDKFSF